MSFAKLVSAWAPRLARVSGIAALSAFSTGCGALSAAANPKVAWAINDPAPMSVVVRRADLERVARGRRPAVGLDVERDLDAILAHACELALEAAALGAARRVAEHGLVLGRGDLRHN